LEEPEYDTPSLQNPPPPPSRGGPPLPPAAAPGRLAEPGLRLVGGLIDLVLLAILLGLVEGVTHGSHLVAGAADLAVALAYFGYMWSSRGQTIGMMVFNFHVRDQLTGQRPGVGMAIVRGLIWWLEVAFCCVGAIGWLWMFWDARHQALHDKVARTIVTAG
jgi:uncharacterized RDD family membrane protein YckC